MSIKIYHNPRCSKSRQTLEIIREAGAEPEIVEYLKDPLSIEEIKAILKTMAVNDPREIMRPKETIYKELGLDNENSSKDVLVRAIAENPILLERPIVITDKGACLGRPPENVKEIL